MSAARSEKSSVLSHALKDALIAAIVAFGLFILLLGFLIDDMRGPGQLIGRPVLLASVVGMVFVGRFLISLLDFVSNPLASLTASSNLACCRLRRISS